MPFEEDEKDPSIWFLDHNYHESMFSMFKRINGNFSNSSTFCIFSMLRIVCLYHPSFVNVSAKEHIVGWYSTGPKLRENDLDIHQLFHK